MILSSLNFSGTHLFIAEINVSFEKGVKDLKVSLENQTVYVKYDVAKTSEETLKKSIESLGYPVSGTVKPGHEHGHEHQGHDHGHDQIAYQGHSTGCDENV